MKIKKPEILSSHIVAQSRLFKVEALDLLFSNGVKRTYERMAGSGRDSVMIVPMTDNNSAIFIEEYAAGTHNYEIGFPKGLIDEGETAEQAANRELMEEIGMGAKHFFLLKTVTMTPSYFAGKMHIYIAFDLFEQYAKGDEPEPLQPFEIDISKFNDLLASEKFNEARSITALLLAQRWLENNKIKSK